MPLTLAFIVEGKGDEISLPKLVARTLAALDVQPPFRLLDPIRVARDRLVKQGELERAVQLAVLKSGGHGAVLVLLDADDDCPAQLGPDLQRRASAAAGTVPVQVVLANREFEAWFLASARSLAGLRGLSADLEDHPNPDSVRGAKEWLTANMPGARAYSPVRDQPELVKAMDLDAARQGSRSFRKFWSATERLVEPTATTVPPPPRSPLRS